MIKFKFKLETVLNVRTRVEDLRKKELQVAEVKKEQAKKVLIRRQTEVSETIEVYRKNCQQKMDLYLATNYHKFLLYQNKQVDLATNHLMECDNVVAHKREELVEASKEKKIVEKLKEKAFEVYKAEEMNEEVKFLDELGTGQFVRRDMDEKNDE